MDSNITACIIAFFSSVTAIATAYIWARYKVTKNNQNSKDPKQDN